MKIEMQADILFWELYSNWLPLCCNWWSQILVQLWRIESRDKCNKCFKSTSLKASYFKMDILERVTPNVTFYTFYLKTIQDILEIPFLKGCTGPLLNFPSQFSDWSMIRKYHWPIRKDTICKIKLAFAKKKNVTQ